MNQYNTDVYKSTIKLVCAGVRDGNEEGQFVQFAIGQEYKDKDVFVQLL